MFVETHYTSILDTLCMNVLCDDHFDNIQLHAGLRIPGDQRQITPALPMHLAEALAPNEGAQPFPDPANNG